MRKKMLTLTLSVVMAFSLMTGCGKSNEPVSTETATEEAAAATTETADVTESDTEIAAEPETEASSQDAADDSSKPTTDRSGNSISIPENVDRIISMAPSTTRFLIDLGLADKIVAIDTNSYAYIEVLPTGVQQFDMMAPDNEALVALKPDIIFTSGMSSFGGEDVFQPARDAGICVADIPSSTSFDEIADDLSFIGAATGCSEKAAELINEFKDKIDQVKEIGSSITEKKTILFMISLPSAEYPSIYTFGKGTYLDEMITDIGAVNVTGDQEGWISISEEEAIAMNPDVIVTNINYVEDVVNTIKNSTGWENVNAIKNDEVYYIDADSSNQPNNHTVDAMIEMAEQVYPDKFADFR